MKRTVIGAAVIAVAGTVLVAPSAFAAPHHDSGSRLLPTAHAPRNSTPAKRAPGEVSPATAYNGACGTGYGVIDTLPVSTLGTVYLTYNSSNGNNCVVTVRATSGSATYMVAAIERSDGSSADVDEGNYTTYAGPVYVHAPGSCIDWAGQIGSVYTGEDNSHCG